MSVFFNGQLLTTPTSASVVDDSALANRNLSIGNNLAVLGLSTGGQPNTPLVFGSPSEAAAVLISGDLLDAVTKAFDPSSQTNAPAQVTAIRVNPALQSSLSLLDATPVAVINLVSTGYGAYTNSIKVKVEAGSTSGKKLTTQIGSSYYTADNIARNSFQIRYSGGQASATMSIAGTTVTLQAPTGTTVASIDLTQFPTVTQLVDRINTVAGFAASIQGGNDQTATLNGLDYVTSQDVKTANYIATANLQAVVDWFNSVGEGFVTATRVAAVGNVPANVNFTYLAGGSDGTVTNTEWTNAFTTLQSVDVQWIAPLSSNGAIASMADAHAQFMSGVGKKERRAICGTALGTTITAAVAAALAINSDRTSLVYQGYYDYDANGNLKLFQPYITAAVAAAGFCGLNPGNALTNKAFKFSGLESSPRNPTDTDVLINGGVMAFETTAQGYKCVKSISTWMINDNYNRVEQSTGVALDFVVRNVREACDVLRGQKNGPILLSRAVSIAKSQLDELARPEPSGPGVIVGDAANPPYKNVRATADGDVIRIEFQCSPAIPANYVLTTVYAVPYSGTASGTTAA